MGFYQNGPKPHPGMYRSRIGISIEGHIVHACQLSNLSNTIE
jgi:hypothetical protein